MFIINLYAALGLDGGTTQTVKIMEIPIMRIRSLPQTLQTVALLRYLGFVLLGQGDGKVRRRDDDVELEPSDNLTHGEYLWVANDASAECMFCSSPCIWFNSLSRRSTPIPQGFSS